MKNNKKTFVLDTSVLLYNAKSLTDFSDNHVVIPYVVLEELDKFKTRDDLVGTNAREVSRTLNKLRKEGPLNTGVVVNPSGGTVRVELNFHERSSNLIDPNRNDDRILNVCLGLIGQKENVTLVTKDINLAVRADILGVKAEDYDTDRPLTSVSELYSGTSSLTVEEEVINSFYGGEKVYMQDLDLDLPPNHYLTLVGVSDKSKSAIAKVSSDKTGLLQRVRKGEAWGLKSRNREQNFAIDALLDPNLSLVTLAGPAGTGKSLCALACALQMVHEEHSYNRLVVSRPVQPLGKDIGFLPGDLHEKMSPWMGPIKDALDFLSRDKTRKVSMYDQMLDMGMLEVEPLTYIRGRSIPNTVFIVDEVQDTTRPEIKTIVSRMGENSKLVLVGDVMQVTNPYLDGTNNGLSNIVEKFKSYGFAAHVTLDKGERSELATVASEIL